MTKTQTRNLVTTTGVITVKSASCSITQIVIGVQIAGLSIRITNINTPVLSIVPVFTTALSTDGKPIIMNFVDPVYMDGGVKIIANGTGDVSIWMSMSIQKT